MQIDSFEVTDVELFLPDHPVFSKERLTSLSDDGNKHPETMEARFMYAGSQYSFRLERPSHLVTPGYKHVRMHDNKVVEVIPQDQGELCDQLVITLDS